MFLSELNIKGRDAHDGDGKKKEREILFFS